MAKGQQRSNPEAKKQKREAEEPTLASAFARPGKGGAPANRPAASGSRTREDGRSNSMNGGNRRKRDTNVMFAVNYAAGEPPTS